MVWRLDKVDVLSRLSMYKAEAVSVRPDLPLHRADRDKMPIGTQSTGTHAGSPKERNVLAKVEVKLERW